jgi:uncharacterized protein (DUF952 family)
MHTIKEMVAVMVAYIHHRTGKQVEINMNQFRDIQNQLLLNSAYNHAMNWFKDNKGDIQLI